MTRLTLVLGLIGLSALLFACTDDGDGEPAATSVPTEVATEAATEMPAATATEAGGGAATATATATETGGGEEGETTVDVELSDFAISLSQDSAPAGEVRFVAENTGATPHELVIIKTDLAEDALPVDGATVDESAVDVIGEIEEFPAGETRDSSFSLDAGAYVLICNVAGHYQLGMHTPFTVE